MSRSFQPGVPVKSAASHALVEPPVGGMTTSMATTSPVAWTGPEPVKARKSAGVA
jgi:hypothetical protein